MNEELGWYVSDVHCERAIKYLYAKLLEEHHLPADFPEIQLLNMWGEALGQTMSTSEPSPIGPDPELARKFLLATIEKRLERMEERGDRAENAISTLTLWLVQAQTGFSELDRKGIDRILYGEIATETRRHGQATAADRAASRADRTGIEGIAGDAES